MLAEPLCILSILGNGLEAHQDCWMIKRYIHSSWSFFLLLSRMDSGDEGISDLKIRGGEGSVKWRRTNKSKRWME